MENASWIHTADLHLGKPSDHLQGDQALFRQRTEEYRQAFQHIISLVNKHQVPFLLIAGDFLEHGYVSRSLWDFVQEQLLRIPNTQVFIAPGNHDPYREDSVYRRENWPQHVHIFSSHWEDHYFPAYDLQVVGRGFADFSERAGSLPTEVAKRGSRRLLIAHGDFLKDRRRTSDYFPLYRDQLAELDYDYVALGHIHKANSFQLSNQNKTLVRYPGSPAALTWKETGQRTVTWGQWSGERLETEEIAIDTAIYEVLSCSITGKQTKEQILKDLIEHQDPALQSAGYCMVQLEGFASLVLDFDELENWLPQKLHEKYKGVFFIQNQTLPSYDFAQLRRESQILAKFIHLAEERQLKDQEIATQALYKGLEAFMHKRCSG